MKKFMLSTIAILFFLANVSAATAAAPFIPPFAGQHKVLADHEAYYDGGVGITERQQMTDMTKDFNLRLVFDTTSGAYLSAVAVQITDAKGKILIDTVSQGPWFSAKLAAAKYRITATFENRHYTRNVALTQKPRTLIMSWPVS